MCIRDSLSVTLLSSSIAYAQTPPAFKPSKYSEAPIDITTDAYGAYKNAPDAPRMGDTLVDFTLPKARGGIFTLSEALKQGPMLIMFYRGHW